MNFRIIKTVISREYTTRVKKKSFLVTTFLVPVLFAAFMVVMVLVMGGMKGKSQNAAVIDRSGIVMAFLESSDRITYEDFSDHDPDTLKNHLEEYGKDVMVLISPLDTADKTVSVQTYSKKPLGMDFSSGLAAKVDDAVEAYRIEQYGIEGLEQIMEDVKSDVSVAEYTLDEDGNETVSESGIYMIVSMILGIIIFMFVAMFGAQVMSSVIEEKSSRVVEVLISSVRAIDLMFGKIIGVALVALTQFLLWIVLTVILVSIAGTFMGKGLAESLTANPEMMAQTMEMASASGMPTGTVDLSALAEAAMQSSDTTALAAASDSTAVAGAPTEMQVILSTLMNIPWGTLVISFLIYFLLGYLLYASLYAAIGSAVENEGDAQQLQLPITIPLMIAYFIALVAYQNPDSAMVVWGSMIPFTSPIVMLTRIPFGVPVWQIVLSIVLLLLTFVACAWISAKIYKVGILMFGKKTTFKDLWKWLRQN